MVQHRICDFCKNITTKTHFIKIYKDSNYNSKIIEFDCCHSCLNEIINKCRKSKV